MSFSPAQQRWTLVAAILASSMAFIDFSAVNVVLPSIQEDLKASGAAILWISNMAPLLLAALMLVGGSFGDRYGRKRIFMTGIALFSLGSVFSGFAPSVPVLVLARAIQGIGGAMMIPGSLAMITAVYDSKHRGKAIGTWSAITPLTTALGPVIAGYLASADLWRGVFFIAIPLGATALFLLATRCPESKDHNAFTQIDWLGTVLIVMSLAGLSYGFIEAPRLGFADPSIWGTLAVGAVALILFVFAERRSPHPLVPLHIFRSRTFTGSNILTLLLYGALSGILFFFPLNAIQIQEYDPSVVGFMFLPFVLMMVLLSRWAGGLVDKIGPRLPLTIGPIIASVGMLLFARIGITDGPADYWTTFFPAIGLIGLGMAITVAPLSTAVMSSVPQHHAGLASGLNNAVSRAAGVLAAAVLGSMMLFSFSSSLEQRAADIGLPPAAQAELLENAKDLGATQAPGGLSTATANEVRLSIRQSFADSFNILAYVTAGLGFLSALLAWFMIRSLKGPEGEDDDQHTLSETPSGDRIPV